MLVLVFKIAELVTTKPLETDPLNGTLYQNRLDSIFQSSRGDRDFFFGDMRDYGHFESVQLAR